MRRPSIFGLRPVDFVAEDPPPGTTMRIYASPAEIAFTAAGRYAGDEDAVTRLESGHVIANLVDDTDALMSQDSAGLTGRYMALEDVEICAADQCVAQPLRLSHSYLAVLLRSMAWLASGAPADGLLSRVTDTYAS
ncbi:hypothetical protein J2R87_009631 [Bradyrhizobium elkanii]|jgi:hypothetical protein|nr:hypothetical protein [Bradyrhizobium elkanii]MCP1975824.1 hypothetical protein [Bradyrhizobium elkanii]MCP1985003.1 hypothetical protein [Bradyrhizobium elkanii]MCS3695246.1 hypothetical protein [Bradyrhizobium elkanii]MCS3890642.1 hypothetical protein [Bradyrhizobium elkanii]